MKKIIKVFAPATVANIGCGFDSMGLAIDAPGDELRLELNNEKKIYRPASICQRESLPVPPNLAGLRKSGKPSMERETDIPL